MLCPVSRCHGELCPDARRPGIGVRMHGAMACCVRTHGPLAYRVRMHGAMACCIRTHGALAYGVRMHGAMACCVRIHIACAFRVGSSMSPARVHPERPECLVRLDAACASGRRFFFLMHFPEHEPVLGPGATQRYRIGLKSSLRFGICSTRCPLP